MRKLLTKCFQWCLIAFAVAGGTQALAQTRTASALKPLDYVQRYRSELDKDDFDYAGTARGLFYFYVAQGNLERALPLISEIDWGWRGEALILIEEAAKKGPRKLLLRTLDIALAREKKENPDEPDNRFLSQLVVLLIRFQETERAESLAEKLAPNELGTVDAFLALAEAQLHTDREKATQFLERARREIDLEDLENILWHCQWLKKIAQAYQTLAEPQKVAEILVVIKELAPQENELKRDYPLSELAEGYALNGEFDQATQLADKFALENRLTAYTRLAVICLRQGERKRGLALLESALRLTEQLEGEYAKGGDLERIVRVYLSADLPDAAAKTVKLIKYDYHLQEAATAFADWCLKRNQPEKALEVLDFAAQELKSLVSEKREEIEPQMSFSIARSKAGGLAEIAAKYRQMGQLERALDTAKAIDLPQWRTVQMAEVGVLLACAPETRARAASLLAEAESVAQHEPEYPHDFGRLDGLSRIAQSYAAIGDPIRSNALFAQLLRETIAENDDPPLRELLIIATRYEAAKLQVDATMRKALQEMVKKWPPNIK